MSVNDPSAQRPPRRVGRVIVVVLAALGGLAAVAWVAGRAFFAGLEARRIEREGHTVVEAIRKVARLTTVEMNVSSFQLRKDARKLLGFIPISCEKTVAIFYRGRVAAGFDLGEAGAASLRFTTTPASRRLVVELPAPRLLYTDAPPPDVVVADGSVCNQLEAADYQALSREARTALEREALQAGILRKAEQHARELVEAVAAPFGFATEVKVAPTTYVTRNDAR